jgi:hypothetical protein
MVGNFINICATCLTLNFTLILYTVWSWYWFIESTTCCCDGVCRMHLSLGLLWLLCNSTLHVYKRILIILLYSHEHFWIYIETLPTYILNKPVSNFNLYKIKILLFCTYTHNRSLLSNKSSYISRYKKSVNCLYSAAVINEQDSITYSRYIEQSNVWNINNITLWNIFYNTNITL